MSEDKRHDSDKSVFFFCINLYEIDKDFSFFK